MVTLSEPIVGIVAPLLLPRAMQSRSVPRMRSVPDMNRLNPRTNKRKRAVRRFCGNCGYELAVEGDGKCPMCPRFEQVRVDSALPRANDLDSLGTRRTELVVRQTAIGSGEHAPTVSDYGLIGVERARSGPTGGSVPAGARNPAVRATLAPPADSSGSSTSASVAATEETAPPSPQQSTTPPKKVRGRSLARTAGPETHTVAVRHHASPSHGGVTWPSPDSVATLGAFVAIGALIGIAVLLYGLR
jgi:hypothetical protein